MFPPQGLCTGCPLYLAHSSLRCPSSNFPHFIRDSAPMLPLQSDFPGHYVQNSNTSFLCPAPILPSLTFPHGTSHHRPVCDYFINYFFNHLQQDKSSVCAPSRVCFVHYPQCLYLPGTQQALHKCTSSINRWVALYSLRPGTPNHPPIPWIWLNSIPRSLPF